MMIRSLPLIVSFTVVGFCLSLSADSQTFTFTYNSEPGDFIGQGNSATWTEQDGDWTARANFDNGVSFSFSQFDPGNSFWSLDFAAADEAPLVAGTYTNAQRFPFQDPGRPGLSVFGEGRGCNTLTGEFTVVDVLFDWFDVPVRFDGSLEQHCEGAAPALFATMTYDLGFVASPALTAGNLLVSQANRLFEYTPTGTLVQAIPILGDPAAAGIEADSPRDVALSTAGRIHVYNGTFEPALSSLDIGGGSWRHDTFPDWNTVNNVSYGGIGTFSDFVYVTDMLSGGSGIVRFDTGSGYTGERFQDGTSYIDLTVGLDGVLYGLRSGEVAVDRLDPVSMSLLGTVTLDESVRGIAVNAAGEIFGASWSGGTAYRFSSDGTTLASLVLGGNLIDIDLNGSGTVVIGSRFGDVHLTSEALANASTITLGGGNDEVFVSLVPALPLFADGFESGDFSAWTSTIGQ